MTVMSSTRPAGHAPCPPAELRGLFLGLVAGALAMWLILASGVPLAPTGGDLSLGASDLPDWHGNVMRSHWSE